MNFVELLYLICIHNYIFTEPQQGLFLNRNQSGFQCNLLSEVIVFLAVTFFIFPQSVIFCRKLIVLRAQNFRFLLSSCCDFLRLRIGCIKRFLSLSTHFVRLRFGFFPDVLCRYFRTLFDDFRISLCVTHDISEAISLSDRIVVLSHRPATVKAIHDLGALRTVPPLERRSRPEFQALFNQIWEELDVNV